MLSTFIRLGAALSCAALLSACGGNSVAETQQSTPEGIFTGTYNVKLVNQATGATDKTCTENVLTFAVATGSIYTFYPSTNNPAVLNAADYGALTFSGGAMSSSIVEVVSPGSSPLSTVSVPSSISSQFSPMCDSFAGNVATANLTGAYNTGINIGTVLTFGTVDAAGDNNVSSGNLPYDTDYQGVQSLSTLAGTYNGYVSTSQSVSLATFVISPASVPANAGNDLGVSVVTGTDSTGCSYTGSVSPLFKGNGYTLVMSSGTSPCNMPQTQFSGLIYLNTKTNILYSLATNPNRTDGVLFSGKRS